MLDCPPLILELVERFTLNKDRYLSPNYNEEELRHEFLNPMFELLGWDMTNRQGSSEAFKDVVYEKAIKAGAPDYSFRFGGTRMFFLEAKAPHVDIAHSPRSAAQLRSYAWSAKLSLSILSDFAHFAAYDGRIPIRTDLPKPQEARVLLIPYTEYASRWNEIHSIFSKEAVRKGLFHRFAEERADKGATTTVDEEFLNQISRWREKLARSLREANPTLTGPELNFAVQMTIDRIVFLRIAEDRGIGLSGELQRVSKVTSDVYGALFKCFEAADAKYNSGLFHFRKEPGRTSRPDQITSSSTFQIRDEILRTIIQELYPPKSHYRFSHVPSEILGQVYEQFLGKVIVLTPKHAKVEEKPEVRKAGGVYYTPFYIVDFIVKNTVAKVLQGKTPDAATKLTVLDPACGSGSFLLGAYQLLLDWHLDYYFNHDPERIARQNNPPIRQIPMSADASLFDSKPSYRLTIHERKRILTNNIFGVDIDPQAVEVTKLSLLLKCLEGETAETIEPLFKFHRQRALPDLDDNIKCGNSLISPDFYDPRRFPENQDLLDDEKAKINVFDWNHAFPKIMRSGFDVVIGNPPYLYSAGQERTYYFASHFRLAEYQTDFYVYFLEKAFRLAKKGGLVSFIISDSWLKADNFHKVRTFLLTQAALDLVAVFNYPVFKVALENSLLVAQTQIPPRPFPIIRFLTPDATEIANTIKPEEALSRQIIDPKSSEKTQALVAKLETRGQPLGSLVELNRGIHAYRTDGYGRTKFGKGPQTKRDKDLESYHADKKLDRTYLPELKGKQVHRFFHAPFARYISYGPWLAEPREPKFFLKPKIILRKILGLRLHGTFVEGPTAIDQSLYIAIINDDDRARLKFLLGILLSSIGAWWLRTKYAIYDKLYPWYTKKHLASFPIPRNDDRLVPLVDRMLDLHIKLAAAKLGTERDRLQREIAATDSQIDTLVYDLYYLTPNEIKLVESATQP